MFISKISLPRRAFLGGIGATLALPFLDAMTPALSAMAATSAKPQMRLGFFYTANGVTMAHWRPKGVGSQFELSPILNSLAPFKDQVVVISGLANTAADVKDVSSGPHTRCQAAWLSGVAPKRTEGTDIQLGKTLDQYAADELGKDTPLTSLELALEPNFVVGNCDNGYSCVYQNTFSWRSPTIPLPMENNPRVVFERMFGDGSKAAARIKQMRQDRSILDAVTEDMKRLLGTLGPGDRNTVEEYLAAVRDVESRIHRSEKRAAYAPEATIERPLGIPVAADDHAKLMIDLQFLAYQADITRVVTFQVSREQSQRTYPFIGVPNGHHEISHHMDQPARMALNSKINAYHVSLMGHLAEKLKGTPDGDGTLLDHTILMYGAGMGDGDVHSPHDLPFVLVGGGCGQLKGGRHLEAKLDTPLMNVGLSVLEKAGIPAERIGDSTGRLFEL
jgi:hypothetical protein